MGHATDSPPVVIQSVTKLFPRLVNEFDELEAGDFLILDLDNTVFREVQMLGTDEWWAHSVKQRMGLGEHKRDAENSLAMINQEIKKKTKMALMEPELPEMIAKLQRRRVRVIGITARHPNLAALTHMQLRKLAVDFSRTEFPGHMMTGYKLPELHNAFLFSGNIAFTDGSPKGLVLKYILRRVNLHPGRVVAIDDRIHHVHTFVETLLELGIPGYVIHYLRFREFEEFNPQVADLQFEIFKREGRLVSDDEARAQLSSCPQLLAAAGS